MFKLTLKLNAKILIYINTRKRVSLRNHSAHYLQRFLPHLQDPIVFSSVYSLTVT